LISAPIFFLVSGPELVIAACQSAIIGLFPTANCQTLDELDAWLCRIVGKTKGAAAFAPNLIVHKSNNRLTDDAALVAEHCAQIVIASVGSPVLIIEIIHEYGGLIFADIASIRHAEKAIATGVDGLILLMAGAGGQTGWANPFAFVRAVRAIFDGPLVPAGGVSDGVAVKAAVTLGCDLAYMRTRFIATRESMAVQGHKDMLVASSLDDVMLTSAFTGLPASKLRPSIVAAGLDPDALPERGMIDITKDINPDKRPKHWKNIWSAGYSVSGLRDIPNVAALVDRLADKYLNAE
jgi:nitronate monooxygenase